MKRDHPRFWTAAQLEQLVRLYPDHTGAEVAGAIGRPIKSVYAQANALGLHKSEAFLAGQQSGRIRRAQQHPAMIASRFQPGIEPWNKGKSFAAGGRSAETQFKPGQRPHTWVPIGSYRITTRDGYLKQKRSDTGVTRRDWVPVHRLVWEAAHGPILPGHIVIFKGRRPIHEPAALTADRLECIDRAEHARRNHPRNKSPELARLVQLKGAITRQVNRIQREAEQP